MGSRSTPFVPGLIPTRPYTRHRDRYAQAADEFTSQKPTSALEADAKAKLIAKSPLGIPWIEPEAIAPVVVFLASDDARMVSGATPTGDGRRQRQLQCLSAVAAGGRPAAR